MSAVRSASRPDEAVHTATRMLIVINPVRRTLTTWSIAGLIAPTTSGRQAFERQIDEPSRRLLLAELARQRGQEDQEREQREQGR